MAAENDLLALPDEMIIAIIAYLDVLTIIALKRTCFRLYDLSKLHAVWCNGLSSFRNDHPDVPCQLEGPMTFYTSQELETIVTRLYRLDRNWKDPNASQTPYRSRELDHSEEAYDKPKPKILIPGGRWLLSFTGQGSVLAFDLEAPPRETGISNTVLMTVDNVQRFTAVTYCLRADEARLTFDLAMVYEVQHPAPAFKIKGRLSVWRQVTTRMAIYRVTLDGPSRADSQLQATCLRTIDLSPEHRQSISLYGDMVAIDRRDERNADDIYSERASVDVIDWTKCSDTAYVGTTFRCAMLSERMGVVPFCLYLASSRWILAVAANTVLVYKIPTLELIDCKFASLSDLNPSTFLKPTIIYCQSAENCIAVSPPIPFTIRPKDQTILTAHPPTVHLVRIPSDPLSEPTFEDWDDPHPEYKTNFCVLGHTRAVWTVNLFFRDWRLASVDTSSGRFSLHVIPRGAIDRYPPGRQLVNQGVLFDEVSGRMLLGTHKNFLVHKVIAELE